MTVVAALTMFLRGEELGEVRRLRNGRLRLRFATSALGRWGEGSRPLSLSLPLTERRVEGPELERFLDNLLPEGAARAALEREHHVRPGDTFGLLSHVGAECAGAVQLLPEGAEPTDGHLRPLDDAEVARIVADLPTLEPPDGLAVTASLGGIQAKVLLHRTSTGWAWPADGAMSTHLIKPEPWGATGVPHLVQLEHWTLGLARAAGIPAARSELVTLGGREAIVVERFDRADGSRLHQEDLAQALGLAAVDKYEGSGTGPGRLATVARQAAAEAVDPSELLRDLLRQVTFNVVIGNGDAHAKNYSFTIDQEASYGVAPLYDTAPVFLVSADYRHSGMAIAGKNRLDLITGGDLVLEAESWGMRADDARAVVVATAEAVTDAVGSASELDVHADVPAALRERAGRIARSSRR
ncbi:HipA domain-containing protein [Krasilnikoviella flava]|uniref:Serine/threonine-protein kinase HipA n=1 Tax=Krasilnikoviella flava TaxID=526729 RepID=A0A1T5JK67_9MICO|nr:HipA domain-containing protein [Krasilnikoviella flava]SKC51809.1 serine/threonine-protein kinase HipA [Krasilnikoviella flava]